MTDTDTPYDPLLGDAHQQLARLRSLQTEIIERADVISERNAVMFDLWMGGMTQREIADELSAASLAAGGPEVTEHAVQKVLWRHRSRHEQKLLDAVSSDRS